MRVATTLVVANIRGLTPVHAAKALPLRLADRVTTAHQTTADTAAVEQPKSVFLPMYLLCLRSAFDSG